jgi:hypothetical protein
MFAEKRAKYSPAGEHFVRRATNMGQGAREKRTIPQFGLHMFAGKRTRSGAKHASPNAGPGRVGVSEDFHFGRAM